MKNKHASALGKLSKGKPKTLSDQERQNRRDRLSEARKKRWLTPASAVENPLEPDVLNRLQVQNASPHLPKNQFLQKVHSE